MKKKLSLCALLSTLVVSTAFADCTFTFVNKSKTAVTLQGYFLDDGDALSDQAWLTVGPTREINQVRTGKKCTAIYKHTGELSTRVDLKNNSGYWNGNKGFLFAADRSYSHYTGSYAKSDTESAITLSNAVKVSGADFKVYICDASVDPDDCH
jgi:hypothetical protein